MSTFRQTDQPELPTQEPYPFATILRIKSGGRHELLTAVIFSGDPPKCGNGWRYQCLFPVKNGIRVGKVYSEEIEAVTGMDLDGVVLCSGCPDSARARCKAQGISPATCC